MDRRGLLAAVAGSSLTALTGCSAASAFKGADAPSPGLPTPARPTPEPLPTASAVAVPRWGRPAGIEKHDLPDGVFSKLPGEGNLIALTIDDGEEVSVLRAYADLAQRTGIRLTFFVNGIKQAWTDVIPVMRPLVESGQVLLANHGWSHEDLTELSSSEIKDEIRLNEDFLIANYGVTGRPFLRPPFGAHSSKVRRIADDLGYPAIAMWYGSLGDSSKLAPATIVANAREWFQPQSVVLGHADFASVNGVVDQLAAVIRERELQPVHLGDVFDLGQVQQPTRTPSHVPTPTPNETETASPSRSSSVSVTPPRSPSKSPSLTPSARATEG